MSKCKRWCFTSFEDAEPVFDGGVHEYLIYGRETCPDTARPHWQGYICFNNRTTLAGCKRFLPSAHFERAKGTPLEASNYCKKDGDYKEYGILPTTTGRASVFGDALAKAESGDIDAIKTLYPGVYIRYKANILSSIKFSVEQLDSSCGVWICGPPRCGKDYSVRSLVSVYVKSCNKWWDGYRNEENVLISDVEPDQCKWLGYFLKIWMDCYAFNAEIKGGSMLIRPKKIFVTSNFTLEDCFNGETLNAIRSRCNVYNLFTTPPTVEKRVNPVAPEIVLSLLKENENGVVVKACSTSPDVVSTEQLLEQQPQAGTENPRSQSPIFQASKKTKSN